MEATDDTLNNNIMDTSWINEYEKDDKSYKIFYQEPIIRIKVNILYVNRKCELEKMRKEIMYLSNPNMIKKEEILHFIKNHNMVDSIKYNLANIIVYNIDIQNYEIKNYLNGCDKYNFINNLRNIDDYELKSTLNYLHEINNIYIIFNEEEKKEFKSTIKKINDDVKNNVNHNNTKRVKFNVPNKKTRRRKH